MTTEKFIGNTGDIDWINHGGTLIMQDINGDLRGVNVNPWMLDCGEAEGEFDPKMRWEVTVFCLDKLKLRDDGKLVCPLSDTEEWFSDEKSLKDISSCVGSSVEELKEWFTSDSPYARAQAYDSVASYHGYINLDCSPEMLTRVQLAYSWFARLEREEREEREGTLE